VREAASGKRQAASRKAASCKPESCSLLAARFALFLHTIEDRFIFYEKV
jgi:hypothetical protein